MMLMREGIGSVVGRMWLGRFVVTCHLRMTRERFSCQ